MDPTSQFLSDLSLHEGFQSQHECLIGVYSGRFREAEAFYQQALHTSPYNIPLNIDYARCLYKQCRYAACAAHVAQQLAHIQDATLSIKVDPGELQLLELIHDAALVYSRGNLSKALRTARKAHQALRKKSAEEFTDVEADTVEFSLRIIKNVQFNSNWANREDKVFPSIDSNYAEWLGYDSWQKILTNKGKYWQALTILDLTDKVLPPQMITGGFERIFDHCQQQEDDVASTLVALEATISSSRHYGAQSNFSQGHKMLQRAETLVNKLKTKGVLLKGTNLELKVVLASMNVQPNQNLLERAHQYIQIARGLTEILNYGEANACFTAASETALQVSAWAEFLEWRQENETLQAEHMHDIQSLLMGRSRHWRFNGGKDITKLIEWFDNFEAANPSFIPTVSTENVNPDASFDIPTALHMAETAKRDIFIQLGDRRSKARLVESEVALNILQDHLPIDLIASNAAPFLQDFAAIDRREQYPALKALINCVQQAVANGMDDNVPAQLLGLSDFTKEKVQEIDSKKLYDLYFTNPENLWPQKLELLRSWLNQNHSAVETGAGSYLLVRLQLLRVGNVEQVDDIIRENEMLLDLISLCKWDVHEMFRRNGLHARSTLALCKLDKLTSKGNSAQCSEYEELVRIWNECLEAYREPSLSRRLDEIGLLHAQLADTYQRQRRLFNNPTLEAIEEQLLKAESVFDELRQDLAALERSSALIGKTDFPEAVRGRSMLRDVAYRVYRRELLVRPDDTAAQVMLWNWVQKSKGRALTDSMGLSTRIPEAFLELIRQNHGLNQKFAKWNAINMKLGEALQSSRSSSESANIIYYLRMERQMLKQEMVDTPGLTDIINIIEGRAIQYSELPSVLSIAQSVDKKEGNGIALVDWFYVQDIWGGRQLYSFIVRRAGDVEPDVTLKFSLVGPASSPVRNWIDKHLYKKITYPVQGELQMKPSSPSSTTAFLDLQNLKGLIRPLQDHTMPGDTLILCPTESLHRLPIHALQFTGLKGERQTLIARNPVLYSHSLSILRFCIFSRLQSPETPIGQSQASPAFSPLSRRLSLEMDIDELHGKASEAFGSLMIEDDAVSETTFYQNVDEADCAFFLGHVHDAGADPLESHLVLYEEEERSKCQHREQDIVKASAILERVRLSLGAHVILISCASGVSYSKSSDEFLGLVPAFIYSGARSTVSTLWPILQLHGVEFSRFYLDGLIRGRKRSGIANLAKCLQKAVLEMKDEYGEEDLASWAAFVFHGY